MLGWDRCGVQKKCDATRYSKLVFLDPMGYVGHVVHFGASGRETVRHYFSPFCGIGTDWTKISLCTCVATLTSLLAL
jgi:hypothetical protein